MPRSPVSGTTATWTEAAPGQVSAVTPTPLTSGCAIGHSPMWTISWDRCLCRPARPSRPTAKLTRVRQPSPGAAASGSSPGSASTVTSRSSPAIRASCWRTTAALSWRWAGRLACCQSQPPQPPGRACGQGGGTRSGDGSRISTASARASLAVTWVTAARTRSPGSACLTNTTCPLSSGRATHQPPCTASPTVSSSTSPGRGLAETEGVTGTILPCPSATVAGGVRRASRGRMWAYRDQALIRAGKEQRAHRHHGVRAGRIHHRPHPRGPGPLGRDDRP